MDKPKAGAGSIELVIMCIIVVGETLRGMRLSRRRYTKTGAETMEKGRKEDLVGEGRVHVVLRISE